MRKFVKGLAVVALAMAGSAQADMLSANFTVLNGVAGSSSGGSLTFRLNADGTIAAALVSTSAPIIGFGFDSGVAYEESGFSPFQPNNVAGWIDSYGSHASGFMCAGCPFVLWTIGGPGAFTSVFDAISGSSARYDFFLLTADLLATDTPASQWAADAVAQSTVPEPASLALLGVGVAGLAAARRGRKYQILRACEQEPRA